MQHGLINDVNIRVVRETRTRLRAVVKARANFTTIFDTNRNRINNNKKRRRVSPTRARGAGGAGKTRDITEIIKQVSQVFPGCAPSAANQFLAAARCFAINARKSVTKSFHNVIFIEHIERCNAAIVLSLLSLVVKKKKILSSERFYYVSMREMLQAGLPPKKEIAFAAPPPATCRPRFNSINA